MIPQLILNGIFGTIIGRYRFDDGTATWYQSPKKYLNNNICIVGNKLIASGMPPFTKKKTIILT